MRDILKNMAEQPLSLEEPWRLRVGSALAYALVKKRDVGGFEKVISFLEATYRILPRLVTPIKHMKILFGLKTMLIMWMFKEGHGVIPTVVKIIQLFPHKLPQYQDQCSQQVMALMNKNQRDFKALAQSLAMNKDKLDYYIKNQMETEYGERYAQKLEERLLHYLDELEAVLPKDTIIDKLLKKGGPMAEEENLLLRVLAFDTRPTETSLKRLLQGRPPLSVSQGAPVCPPCPTTLFLPAASSTAAPAEKTLGAEEDSPLLLEDEEEVMEVEAEEEGAMEEVVEEEAMEEVVEEEVVEEAEEGAGRQQCADDQKEAGEEEANIRDGDEGEEEESSGEFVSSPQFCAKHQRWVRSILQECSEDVPLHGPSSSPSPSPSLLDPATPGPQQPPPNTSPSLHVARPGQGSPAVTGGGASFPAPSPHPTVARSPSPSPAVSPGNIVAAPPRSSFPPLSQPRPSRPASPRQQGEVESPRATLLPARPPPPPFSRLSRLSRRFRRPPAVPRSAGRVSEVSESLPGCPLLPERSGTASPGIQPRPLPSPAVQPRPLPSPGVQPCPPPSPAVQPRPPPSSGIQPRPPPSSGIQPRPPPSPGVSELPGHSTRAPSAPSGPLLASALFPPPQCLLPHFPPLPDARSERPPDERPPDERPPDGARETWALQPHVTLARLSQRQLHLLGGRRRPAARADDDSEEDECQLYLSFDLNALYSGDDSSEHSENSDPDYLP